MDSDDPTVTVPLYGKLAAGRVAVVDARDATKVLKHRWHFHQNNKKNSEYARATIEGKKVYLHRFLVPRAKGIVDHRDSDGLNCRRQNLRDINRSSNNRATKAKKNKHGYKGITWLAKKRVWRAAAQKDGKSVFLGYYKNKKEAALAYDRHARFWDGLDARLNLPLPGEKYLSGKVRPGKEKVLVEQE